MWLLCSSSGRFLQNREIVAGSCRAVSTIWSSSPHSTTQQQRAFSGSEADRWDRKVVPNPLAGGTVSQGSQDSPAFKHIFTKDNFPADESRTIPTDPEAGIGDEDVYPVHNDPSIASDPSGSPSGGPASEAVIGTGNTTPEPPQPGDTP